MAPVTARHAAALTDQPASAALPWAVAGLLLACLWLGGLGRIALFDVDEGAFAQASREMLVSGDWGHTTLNGADRFDKPILVYWLQAFALKLFGVTEYAARLPSALCALGLAAATASFVGPRLGPGSAQIVLWVLASALGPALIGRAATADALLGLLIALAAFDLWRCLEPGADAQAQRSALRRSAVWIGLGLLAKGPVALLIPGSSALLWVLGSPPAERRTLLARLMGDPMAWAWLVVVAAPWYVYALVRHGWAFVDGFLLRHNLERLTGPLEGHSGGPLYFLVALPLLLLPWSPLLWSLLRGARRLWQEPLARYLLGWAGFVVAFFSAAGTKLPHYVLYGVVPLAILLAQRLSQGLTRTHVAAVAVGVTLLVAAALASPGLAQALAPPGDAFWRARLTPATGTWLPDVEPWLIAAAALSMLGWVWLQPRGRTPALIGAAVLAQCVWLTAALPWWSQRLQAPVRSLGQIAANANVPLVQWRVHQPSIGFYRGQPTPRREPLPGEAALAQADHFDALDARVRATFTEMGRMGGFVLVLRR